MNGTTSTTVAEKVPCVMSGEPTSGPVEGIEVRPLREVYLDECEALCKKVSTVDRELRRAHVRSRRCIRGPRCGRRS